MFILRIMSNMKLNHDVEYMSGEHLAYFQQRLEMRKKEILEELKGYPEQLKELQQNEGRDEGDRSSRTEDEGLLFGKESRAKQNLNVVIRALKKCELGEDGDYGFCKCGEEIGLKRLSLVPHASLCIFCQSESEVKDRHKAH